MTMRNQSLTGFAIHQRAFRERSHILHFFSHEFGRVDGVTRQLPPSLYHLTQVHATGKTALKNFSQIDVRGQPFYLQQKALFAGFYLNELLLKLLPIEEAMPDTFVAYAQALEALKVLAQDDPHQQQLKLILRCFERTFLTELGYAIDYCSDAQGQAIDANQYYQFLGQDGFVRKDDQRGFYGQDILNLSCIQDIKLEHISILTRLYRIILNEILGNKPLKSRQLWVSQTHQSIKYEG